MTEQPQPSPSHTAFRQRLGVYLALVVASGSIYFLPYMRQSYHNTMLEVFGISSTELGVLNSVFGVVAMATYLPSGWIADRFSPRKLLTGSLLCTGVSGLYFATFPPYGVMLAIHAFWGVCTILTFWSALIKAVRGLGQSHNQGTTFGGLEAGRGAVEAAFAAAAVFAFTQMGAGASGLAAAIVVYSVVALVAAAAVWFLTEDDPQPNAAPDDAPEQRPSGRFGQVARMPVTWLLAGVVVAAYGAYWGTYDLAAFAEDCCGVGATASAKLSTFRMGFRAAAPLIAGLLADRLGTSRVVCVGFWVVAASFLLFALMPCTAGVVWLLWLNTATIALAVFALRGVYFALLQEGQVSYAITGSVVGAVSLVGYTPDVWAPLLNGWLLDTYPGATGHRYYFVVLAGLSLLGVACASALGRRTRRGAAEVEGSEERPQQPARAA